MARYEFLTTWCVDVPIERVFGVLHDSTAVPEWWNGVTALEISSPATPLVSVSFPGGLGAAPFRTP